MMINLKKIIEEEINRDGQIYFVTPKIIDQSSIKKIRKISESRFAIINGKLILRKLKDL